MFIFEIMILITGATGLVGRHLLKALLQQEDTIKALYRNEHKRDTVITWLSNHCTDEQQQNLRQVIWAKADLINIPELTDAFAEVTHVYHCAGLVSFDVRDKDKLRKINIEGTANVVNLALANQVKKLCHVSSVAALGSEINGKPVTEQSPRNNAKPHDYYDISKFGAETEVWRASQEGLAVIIVNPAVIIGSGNWSSGNGQLFHRVAKGFPFRIPRQSGFVAVDDVVKAMILLLNSSACNERFIILSQHDTIENITAIIANTLGKKPPTIKLRHWMVYGLWAVQCLGYIFGSAKQLTLENLSKPFTGTTYDNSKLKTRFGFNYTPIKEVVIATAQEYRDTQAAV